MALQYFNTNCVIPALADGTPYDALGNPLQYGPIKQSLQPYDKQVATFDGTSSKITLDTPITKSGDFLISFDSLAESTSDGILLRGEETGADFYVRYLDSNRWMVRIDSNYYNFYSVPTRSGSVTVERVGTSLTVTNGSQSETITDVSTADISLSRFGCLSTTHWWAGGLSNLYFGDYHFPLEEGSGETVYGYHTSDSEAAVITGTISTADIGAFWAGTVDEVKSHGSTYGYRLSGSVHIPANPLTGLACDGNSLTNPAGFLNDSQPWGVPETTEMRAADQNLGGEVILDASGNSKPMTGTEWQALTESSGDQLWVDATRFLLFPDDLTGTDLEKVDNKFGVT